MKNRDSKTDKRAEKSTEIAGKMPYHRLAKQRKIQDEISPKKFLKSDSKR